MPVEVECGCVTCFSQGCVSKKRHVSIELEYFKRQWINFYTVPFPLLWPRAALERLAAPVACKKIQSRCLSQIGAYKIWAINKPLLLKVIKIWGKTVVCYYDIM